MEQTVKTSSVDAILTELKANAAKPLSLAKAMSRKVYQSEDILEIEKEKIFKDEWVCIGRTQDIPNVGDYLTWKILDEPVLAVRQPDGNIAAYSNTCRHRMMLLLEGKGTCKRIVCPYHAWTYDLSGQLIGAPYMNKTDDFNKKDIKLPEIRSEVWHGWIYLTLNPNARPVHEKLSKLDQLISRYNCENYVSIVHHDTVWKCNWKLLCENFMEGYHLPVAHRETVGAYCPVDETEFPDADEADENFTYQVYTKDENAPVGTAHPSNTSLEGEWRITSVLPTIFPSHMFSLAPDHLWYLSIQPLGVDQVRIRHGAALAPEVLENLEDPDAFVAEAREFLAKVQEEDRFVVEGMQEGTAGDLSGSGQLSWLEREVNDFTKYIARKITATKGE